MNTHTLRPLSYRAQLLTLCAAVGICTAGCGKDKGDSSDEGGGTVLPGGGEGTAECGGTPPVITEIQCSSIGLKEPEPGATALPTLLMSLFITDEDQDLNSMQVEIYFDEDVDGAVSTQEVIYPPVLIPLSQDTCLDAEATVNIDVFINGVSPRYNQPYEWGVLVRDANNDASELYVFECITPFENGDAGTGEG